MMFDPNDPEGNERRRLEEEQARIMELHAEELRKQKMQSPYQRQTQGTGGISPLQAYSMYSKFAGAGSAPVAATGSGTISAGSGQASAAALANSPSAGVVGSAAGGGSAAGAGSAAGGGWGAAAAAAGPWALLAAAVIANESKQRGDDNRGNSDGEHAGDFASGRILERDADRYLAHNKAGRATKRALMLATPSGAVRNTKDFNKWFKGLF